MLRARLIDGRHVVNGGNLASESVKGDPWARLSRDQLRHSHGYHPVTTDLAGVLATGLFDQLLVFGSGMPDVVDHVVEARLVTEPPVQLPQGIYWFDGIEPRSCSWSPREAPPDRPSAFRPRPCRQVQLSTTPLPGRTSLGRALRRSSAAVRRWL